LVIILPKEVSNATPLKGLWKVQKKLAIDCPLSGRSSSHSRTRKGVNLLIQTTIVFSTDLRKLAERIDARRDQLIQNWNDLSSHSVPQVTRLDIAGVLPK
jgi:hypothetical protein